ncbi:MAG: hypothetical protein ACRESZ_04100 [Methylococcales bacterium]
MVQANEIAESANKLAKYGIPIAAGALVSGIFGMNDFNIYDCWNNLDCIPHFDYILEFLLVILFILVILWIIRRKGEKK